MYPKKFTVYDENSELPLIDINFFLTLYSQTWEESSGLCLFNLD